MYKIKSILDTYYKSKVLKNIVWLFFDKVIRMGIGMIVLILLARYLGPSQYGLLNYIQALIALFAAISRLGLYGVVVRDLVKDNDTFIILGTAFGLKLIGTIFAYIFLVATVFILRPDDELSKLIVAILGLTLIFDSSNIIKYWFESQVKSKYTVFIENSIFVFISLIKLMMIYYEFSFLSFIYIFTFESFLVAFFLFFIYSKQENIVNWKFQIQKAKKLLKDSWPLIISSVAWILYTRIDQIMIGQMLGKIEVGLYSAAIRLSDVANFIPTIIVFSIIPTIIKLKDKNPKEYEKRFQNIYYIVISIMIISSLFVFMLSDEIIYFLYGNEYMKSSKVLAIQFWIIVFVAMATIGGKYFLNAGLQKITMKRHLFGLILNISLNYFMIPIYGIEGAAVASLISLVSANYIFDYFSNNTKSVFIQKTKSLLFFWIFEYINDKIKANNE